MGKSSQSKTVPEEYQEAVTSNRKELATLSACFKELMKHASPRLILLLIAISLSFRIYVGEWSWGDLIVPFVVFASQPFIEWVVHIVVLHMKPFTFAGRRFDMYSAKWHRVHHNSPSDLDQVLIKIPQVAALAIGFAVIAPLVTWGFVSIFGGDLLPLATTAVFFCYVATGRYEWSHFLIHCPYVPKTSYYRKVWRNHRLHHYKHEKYWMGVSSTLSDRVLGTAPDQSTIEKSPTARTLGVEPTGPTASD